MDEKIKEAFKKIAEVLIGVEAKSVSASGFVLPCPRAVFKDALATTLEGKISAREAIEDGLGIVFIQVLEDNHIETKEKDKNYFLGKNLKKQRKQATWITPEVIRGAFGHEKSQPRDAI